MKRGILVVMIVFFLSTNLWAAQAKVTSIAQDPYISALLLDAKTGEVLFSKNPNSHVYPASVTKLMDLLIILDRIKQGKNRLDEMVQITPEAAKIGGSQVYLDSREQFTIDDLLYALMVQSANDAAAALAIHIAGSKDGFVTLMNQKAAELGMKDSHFYSVHGLPPSKGQKTDQTTAHDLAILCRALVNRPEALRYTSTKERGFRNNTFIMRNHNHLLGSFVGCDGLKTGYFHVAGFSIAATAIRDGNRVIALVMGSKNRKVRDAKAAELLSRGLALLAAKTKTEPQKSPEKVEAVAVTADKSITSDVVPEQEKTEVAVQKAPVKKQASVEPHETASDTFHWKTFFGGLLLGLILAGLFSQFRRYRRPAPFSGPRGLH